MQLTFTLLSINVSALTESLYPYRKVVINNLKLRIDTVESA